jgi:hypothetical protein
MEDIAKEEGAKAPTMKEVLEKRLAELQALYRHLTGQLVEVNGQLSQCQGAIGEIEALLKNLQ